MGWWRIFLDSLDSGGGHIVLLFVLMCLGIFMSMRSLMDGTMIVGGAFAALLTILKDKGSNREQSAGSTAVAQVSTTVEPEPTPPVAA